ncbi:protein translocase subunit SecD [Desulfitibacter alkalitolerans]|uniref:protein translocase subunit SecD n=1 Tax=Desulfitibacter alkalitolerans TaxID=264641 RepID=UPI000556E4DF|nr:protein translocase subunit SecD [Desulfitibacter alkalitolerans]
MVKYANTFKLLLVILLVAAISFFSYPPLINSLNLGLDLRGGVHIVLGAIETEDVKVTDEDMEQLMMVMRQRVDELGVSEPYIQREGDKRLIVELAGIDDPEEAVKIIGKTASLEFQLADGTVILHGGDLETAQARMDQYTQRPQVNLKFKPEGARVFAQVTGELANSYPPQDPRRYIAILLDGEVLTNPHVNEAIPDGQAVISGGFTEFIEAANLAALLRAGALPVDVEILEKRLVGPQLGLDSIEKSKKAIAIGITFIILFMLLVYRLNGLAANISLALYGVVLLALISGIKATLTLPGIAGLLLSVGMAVDANIIIYERIKEELRNKKSIRAAVDAGFRRATLTILDANMTTLIGAFVLYFFGAGMIRGFAVTLTLGILASMFTSLIFTRILLRTAVKIKIFQNTRYFGV